MKLLSFQRFDALVKLPPWEVCRRLLDNVSGSKPFKGDVQEATFKIYKNTFFTRTPFRLRLYGVLEVVEAGTKINIKMKISLLEKLQILFVMLIIAAFINSEKLSYIVSVLIYSVVISVGYLGFRLAAKETKESFIKFLEKDIIANNGVVSDAAENAAPHAP